jgi:hypothetical protein
MILSARCRFGLVPKRYPPNAYSSGSLSAPAQQPQSFLGRSHPSSGLFFATLCEVYRSARIYGLACEHRLTIRRGTAEAVPGGLPSGRFSDR